MKTTSATFAAATGLDTGRGVLVHQQWLHDHLLDPGVRVVEVDDSAAAYNDWHIDGAVLWNIYADLKDPQYRPVATADLERLLAGSGIGPDSTVVFYGYAPALAFWLMKLHGHRDVRTSTAPRGTWQAEGVRGALPRLRCRRASTWCGPRTTAFGRTARCARDRPGRARPWWTCVRRPSMPGSGSGPQAAWSQAAGRPRPVAVHQPIDGLYNEDGSFRTADELRRVFSSLDLDTDGELITYCTIGGRAATAWFVLTRLLGRDHVRVYDGSWAEWGRIPAAPVER